MPTPRRGDASIHIAAPPDLVYELVADVTRMGKWSPECYRCEWLDVATSASVGARFRGYNRRGNYRWERTAQGRGRGGAAIRCADPFAKLASTPVSSPRPATRRDDAAMNGAIRPIKPVGVRPTRAFTVPPVGFNRHWADFKNGRPARLRPQALSRSMRRIPRC